MIQYPHAFIKTLAILTTQKVTNVAMASFVFVYIILFSGCMADEEEMIHTDDELLTITDTLENTTAEVPSKYHNEIIVWRHDKAIKLENLSLLESVDVNIIEPPGYPNSYIEGLINNDVDLMIIDHEDYGLFNSNAYLYDLSSSETFDEWYKTLPYTSTVEAGRSYEGSQIFGVMYQYIPVLMYYRMDYLKTYQQNGLVEANLYNDDGIWVSDTQTLLDWAYAAKSQDRSLFQWTSDPTHEWFMDRGYFNDNYTALFDEAYYEKAYEVEQEITNNALHLKASIWDNAGLAALKNGQLEAVFLGNWAQWWLTEQVPEQIGLWQCAPLPFGIKSMYGEMILINKNSPHRELLESYVRSLVERECAQYTSNKEHTSPFFANQNIGLIDYNAVAEYKPKSYSTLDSAIFELYKPTIEASIKNNHDYKTFKTTLENLLKEQYTLEYELITQSLAP